MHMRKPKSLHNFYKSLAWQIARTVKIEATQGKCERCGGIGEEVHHKIPLTIDNVDDALISLNQENLEHLCRECHNNEHGRFQKKHNPFDKDGNFIG